MPELLKNNVKFTKMQGCGNDYVYINGFTEKVENKPEVVRFLSNRNFGIGGDGVIFINPSDIADFEMEMYNADGSRSQMCGNGIRCVGKYVYDHKMTTSKHITVESFRSVKYLDLTVEGDYVTQVRVDMGEPILKASQIPVISKQDTVCNELICIDHTDYRMTCVSMGNPHAVMFVEDVDSFLLEQIGPLFESNETFPERVNAEFVQVLSDKEVKMRVWERGTGETLACGTGCCATTVACILNGLTKEDVMVHVRGGIVHVVWDKASNHVFMTGPAVTVFEGEIDLS